MSLRPRGRGLIMSSEGQPRAGSAGAEARPDLRPVPRPRGPRPTRRPTAQALYADGDGPALGDDHRIRRRGPAARPCVDRREALTASRCPTTAARSGCGAGHEEARPVRDGFRSSLEQACSTDLSSSRTAWPASQAPARGPSRPRVPPPWHRRATSQGPGWCSRTSGPGRTRHSARASTRRSPRGCRRPPRSRGRGRRRPSVP